MLKLFSINVPTEVSVEIVFYKCSHRSECCSPTLYVSKTNEYTVVCYMILPTVQWTNFHSIFKISFGFSNFRFKGFNFYPRCHFKLSVLVLYGNSRLNYDSYKPSVFCYLEFVSKCLINVKKIII